MRILGWVLLIGGFLFCASIVWAAPGFLFMGFGLIFLQIAEQKRRRAKSVASRSERTEPQHEPPPLQELAWALVPPKADEEARVDVDRANATGSHSYDKQRWRLLLSNDADISRSAEALAPYGQKYVDELTAAYLVLNDKEYLPMILRKIIASARRESGQNVASELLHKNSNTDAVGGTLGMARRADSVRDLRLDHAYDPISLNDLREIDADLKKVRVSEPFKRNLSGRDTAIEETNLKQAATVAQAGSDLNGGLQNAVEAMNPNPAATGAFAASDVSQARKTAIEETRLEPAPTVAHAASDVSAAGQIAAEATNPKTPEIPVAPVGRDEKRGIREVDTVDADKLTDILNRLTQVLTSKNE
jgi:hypothetical protein